MYCKECGEKISNDKAVICIKCGTGRGKGDNYCPECGEELKTKGGEICLSCGVRVKSSGNNFVNEIKNAANKSQGSNGQNNKMVAGFLGIFLGGMGIHRFYLGYRNIGFIQLGIFIAALLLFAPFLWIVWIWAIVDVVQIFTGKLPNAGGEELI